jgi:hypothetical protein
MSILLDEHPLDEHPPRRASSSTSILSTRILSDVSVSCYFWEFKSLLAVISWKLRDLDTSSSMSILFNEHPPRWASSSMSILFNEHPLQ